MTRSSIRYLPYALVVVAVWLASGHAPTTAQNPPASDPEKRLQALEQKLDRLLAKIDPQPKAAVDHAALEKSLDLISQAHEVLKVNLERDEQRFADFRKANPILLTRDPSGANLYSRRLEKIETNRGEIRRRLRELEVQVATAEKALKSPDDHVPAILLLKRRGVDLSKLPGVAENDAAAQLRAYLRSLQLEADEQTTLLRATDNSYQQDHNHAREIQNYEVEEDRHKARVAATRELLATVVKRLNEINLVKDPK